MIRIQNLTHTYGNDSVALDDISLTADKGQCILLVGPNGAGKSTLLRILAGKLLIKNEDSVRVLEKDPFRCTTLNNVRSHMDINWGQRTVAFSGHGIPLQADICVRDMMQKLQSDFPERREALIKTLEINLDWRMHMVSDGQRRRVQLFLGLLRPFQLLLMDEVTIALDALVRWNILTWIKKDCQERGALCIYATHIFDGMNDWCTDLMYINKSGALKYNGTPDFDIYERFLEWLRKEDAAIESEDAAEFVNKTSSQNSGGGYANGRLAGYEPNKKRWSVQEIRDAVKLLKNNEVYRLGDAVKFKPNHKVVRHILSNSKYDNTILKLHYQSPPPNRNLYRIVADKMRLCKFQPHGAETLMVHVRLGDDINRRGIGNTKHFDFFVDRINGSGCANVKIVTALHYGTSNEPNALYKQNTHNYSSSNHDANIRKLEELIGRLNKPVEIISNHDIDMDVLHLVFCKHLLTSSTSGAFSVLVQKLHDEYIKVEHEPLREGMPKVELEAVNRQGRVHLPLPPAKRTKEQRLESLRQRRLFRMQKRERIANTSSLIH